MIRDFSNKTGSPYKTGKVDGRYFSLGKVPGYQTVSTKVFNRVILIHSMDIFWKQLIAPSISESPIAKTCNGRPTSMILLLRHLEQLAFYSVTCTTVPRMYEKPPTDPYIVRPTLEYESASWDPY